MIRAAWLAVFLLVVLGGCNAPKSRDLARNPDLYRDIGYHASYQQARRVWIAPLRDQRRDLPTHADGVYPLTYTQDEFWDRPVTAMLDELLRREIRGADLFAEVVDSEDKADWVLRPYLAAFYGAVEEQIVGRAVRGRTALRVQVWGPIGPDGKRALVREQEYGAPVDASGMLFVPDPHALAAASFRKAVALVLIDLDQGGRILDGKPSLDADQPSNRTVEWGGQKPATPPGKPGS